MEIILRGDVLSWLVCISPLTNLLSRNLQGEWVSKRRYRFINKDVHHRPACDSKSYTQPNCSADRKRLCKIPFPPKDYFPDIKNCARRDYDDTRKRLKQIEKSKMHKSMFSTCDLLKYI